MPAAPPRDPRPGDACGPSPRARVVPPLSERAGLPVSGFVVAAPAASRVPLVAASAPPRLSLIAAPAPPRLSLVAAPAPPRISLIAASAPPRISLIAASAPSRVRSASGQAAVEFVVLLPVIAAIVALAWQALLAGQTVWEARVAARAAARAHAFGADAADAARGHLRPGLERGLRVRTTADGDVRVSVRIPTVLPAVRLGRISASSHFRPQGG